MAGRKKSGASKGPGGTYLVFVSHATADKWIARTLCKSIEALGIATFRDDRDIHGGDDIPGEIRRKIVQSNEMLVLITPASVDRAWVLLEVGAAWGRRQRAKITAVLYHVPFDNIPDIIKSKKAISLNDVDDYLDQLAVRAAKYKE